MTSLYITSSQSSERKERKKRKRVALFIYENLETVIIVKLKMLIVLNMQTPANHTQNNSE